MDRTSGMRLRVRQAPGLFLRLIQHPSWIQETVRGASRRRRDSRAGFSLSDHRELFREEAEAVATVARTSKDAYNAVSRRLTGVGILERDRRHTLDGRSELIRVVYGVVSLTKPSVAVETGVAQGATTAAILEAMDRTGTGHLYSIDLPPLAVGGDFIGVLVPQRLRSRWTLRLGPSSMRLPELLADLGTLDLFLHDSDHSYDGQRDEFEVVWPRLKPGGILVCDDVANPALLEFAKSVGRTPYLVGDPGAESAVGLLTK